MKQWRCTVCGYIHTGENPPERCPICGAGKDQFEEVDEDEPSALIQAETTTADVLVVGSGAAAFAAAVTARSRGASVIMLEKASKIGGTTARSGGGFWVPANHHQKQAGIADDPQQALRYMARYSYPNLYNPEDDNLGLAQHSYDLLVSYVENAHKMTEAMEQTGALSTIMEINWTGKAQVDYMDHLPENGEVRGRSLYPKNKDGALGYGDELINQFVQYAKKHDIQVLTSHEVTGILQDENGKVNGLDVRAGEENVTFSANKGVIFGSGGYSHNPNYMREFQRGPHYGGCAVPTNTGDFIRLAGRLGAQLGNMAGAFRAQSMIEQYLQHPGGSSNVFYIIGDSVILVNKYGKRFVDEKRNYTDRTMTHFYWDAQKAEWTNMLTFMLFDERTASLWQGYPPIPVQGEDTPAYLIKSDTLQGAAKEIERRLEAMSSVTGGFQLDKSFLENLQKTISRFNGFAQAGEDADFQRGAFIYDREWTTFPPTVPGAEWPPEGTKNYTMHPLSEEGPYYAIILAAGTLDTNGGPMINKNAQVLDYDDRPIEGLYGAGNCIGSPTANAYWGAGSTIGPAMTFGYIAGMHVTEP